MLTILSLLIKFLITLLNSIFYLINRVFALITYNVAFVLYAIYIKFINKNPLDFTYKCEDVKFYASKDFNLKYIDDIEITPKTTDIPIFPAHVAYNSLIKTNIPTSKIFNFVDICTTSESLIGPLKKNGYIDSLFSIVEKFKMAHVYIQTLRLHEFINKETRERMPISVMKSLYIDICTYQYQTIESKYIISTVLYEKLKDSNAFKNLKDEDLIIYDLEDKVCRPLDRYHGPFNNELYDPYITMIYDRFMENNYGEMDDFLIEIMKSEVKPNPEIPSAYMTNKNIFLIFLFMDMIILETYTTIKDFLSEIFFLPHQSIGWYWNQTRILFKELVSPGIAMGRNGIYYRISNHFGKYLSYTSQLGTCKLIEFLKNFKETKD